jgi:hypothetical protein
LIEINPRKYLSQPFYRSPCSLARRDGFCRTVSSELCSGTEWTIAAGRVCRKRRADQERFVDALTGALVAELPRTPTMADGTDSALDELGNMKTFGIEIAGSKRAMRDDAIT